MALLLSPYWFLAIYQRVFEGNAALPVYAQLAGRGTDAMLLVLALAALSYPVAYWRATRQLVEGAGVRKGSGWIVKGANRLFHAAVCRVPARRAICHFIGQTLMRVPRYRIYFVMYGGLGFALVIAEVLRMNVESGRIDWAFSADGILSAVPYRCVLEHRRIARGFSLARRLASRMELSQHSRQAGAGSSGGGQALGICLGCCRVSQHRDRAGGDFSSWAPHVRALVGQSLVAVGLSLLLADLFFLHVKRIPFTIPRSEERSNLAISMLKYIASFPPFVMYAPKYESWIAKSVPHMLTAAASFSPLICGCGRATVEWLPSISFCWISMKTKKSFR